MLAKWIEYVSDENYVNIEQFDRYGAKAQYFRKTFELSKKVNKANLKVASLGIFKAFINGTDVSNEYFAPGWTNYNKRILLRDYDVTHLLSNDNAISIVVGDGWYAGFLSIKGRQIYGGYPLSLFAELEVTFEDGSTDIICSDESWKTGLGAIGENDFLGGEVYDFRLPHKETSLYNFDDSRWNNVLIAEDKSSSLHLLDYEPVVEHEKLNGILVSENNNKKIYDFGQNFAGVIRIKCVGNSGEKIIIRHAEVLDDDGQLYTANLRLAKATDTIIMNGEVVDYTPTFTYHGFRFVEIECNENVSVLEILGVALYNDISWSGKVSCSNSLVNKLISNIEWGMRSNFIDLPTDCPQRNERLGWSGDTQIFSRTAMFIANCKKFYEKHMLTVDDDRDGGRIPNMAPFFGVSKYDSTGWRDVSVIVPYNLLQFYGDVNKIKEYVPMIKDMLNLQMETSENYLWKKAEYNDWLNLDSPCNEIVIATLNNIVLFQMAIKLFNMIGVECGMYQEFLSKVITELKNGFVSDDGNIVQGTQTVYALSYVAGIISKEQARKYLLKEFTKKNNHIHAGFLGSRFILPILCEVGLTDLAYELICCDTYPSWGYSIRNGATTIWEHWDSYTKEKGFKPPEMNSFNHYSLGACGEWFYEYALGIKPLKNKFEKILIKPFVDKTGRITWMDGSYDSLSGEIHVRWEKCEDGFRCIIQKSSKIEALFDFENVSKIIQDGEEKTCFDSFANETIVYFS